MSKKIHFSYDGTILWLSRDTATTYLCNQTDMTELDSDPIWVSSGYGAANGGTYGSYKWLMFNFPSACTIDKFGINFQKSITVAADISNNSFDGLDGDWTSVLSPTGYTASPTTAEYSVTPLSATWFRIKLGSTSGTNNLDVYKAHLFGEYDTPRFEFWNDAGTYELSLNYPMLMPTAPNFEIYSGVQSFRLKNTDVQPHTYTLSVTATKNGGDSIITNNWTLSQDGGITKAGGIALPTIPAGSFSDVIQIYGDVSIAANPADGIHYFVVEALETA